jgi:hypothetical protein
MIGVMVLLSVAVAVRVACRILRGVDSNVHPFSLRHPFLSKLRFGDGIINRG